MKLKGTELTSKTLSNLIQGMLLENKRENTSMSVEVQEKNRNNFLNMCKWSISMLKNQQTTNYEKFTDETSRMYYLLTYKICKTPKS